MMSMSPVMLDPLNWRSFAFADMVGLGNYVNAAIWSAAEPSMGTHCNIGLLYWQYLDELTW